MNDLSINIELLIRIIIGTLCGIAIGFERKNHFKAAGVKTHMIVGMSSALMMVVSKYGFEDVAGYDAARVAAQIVSGVGFLGAGIIYKRNQTVQGLTTAAGIWATAGVGMAAGAGMYIIAIAGTIIFIVMYMLVQKSEPLQNGIQQTYMIKIDKEIGSANDVLALCSQMRLISYAIESGPRYYVLDATIVFTGLEQQEEWIQEMLNVDTLITFESY